MQIHMLHTPEIAPVPDNIKELENWGHVEAIFMEPINGVQQRVIKNGNHIMLEGEPQAFIDWLKEYDGVVIGEGTPQLQQFSIKHIK